MNLALHGYRILDAIHESDAIRVWRAERERDGRPVVLKILDGERATLNALARQRSEYELLRDISSPGVIHALDLQSQDGIGVLVLEDFGAESLAKLHRQRRFPLETVLALGVDLAEALATIHDLGILHRDINPSNTLYAPDKGTLKLSDFNWSIKLAGEATLAQAGWGIEGTLAYTSPEQTGRMGRAVDHRSDLYSLGVTLYELLTGRLPFEASDPLELVHCHLAREPVPANALDASIPEPVAAIVAKLMSKMPEDRYQSARGCAHDLRTCLRALRAGEDIAHFELGEGDLSERFRVSNKLYGRERELEVLDALFENVRDGGRALLLVSGPAGVGKSSLIRHLDEAVGDARGYFVQGKFEQYHRNVPYAAIASAFGSLVSQLLTEPEAQLGPRRDLIRAALSPHGQVLVDIIPALGELLGELSATPRLNSAATEARFNILFQRFVEVLCSSERPLVLVFDDLQWADATSMQLIEMMLLRAQTSHLLVIGTYRDFGEGAPEPIARLRDEIVSSEVPVQHLALAPLSRGDITALLADTLFQSPAACAELADLCLARTAGNPFFLEQFLRLLHQDGLLQRSLGRRGWRWDIDAVRDVGVAGDAVSMMIERIRRMPAPTQDALQIAASLGRTFDIDTLATIMDESPRAVQMHLLPALQVGLLLPVSGAAHADDAPSATHCFVHDRVQQAAYDLVAEDRRAGAHLHIARRLFGCLDPVAQEQRVFELVEHFAHGARLLDEDDERLLVARLCLVAGSRARATMARETAQQVLRTAMRVLPEDSPQAHYDLWYELALAALEAEYFNGDTRPRSACASISSPTSMTWSTRPRCTNIRGCFSAPRAAPIWRSSAPSTSSSSSASSCRASPRRERRASANSMSC